MTSVASSTTTRPSAQALCQPMPMREAQPVSLGFRGRH